MNKKELGALIIDGTDDFYRVAKSILKEDADCQDAVQEAVSKAFAKIDTLREKKYAKTWFIRILLNECYRMLRQRKREAELVPDELVVDLIMNRFPEKRLGNINIQICIRKSCHWKSNIGCRWYCII